MIEMHRPSTLEKRALALSFLILATTGCFYVAHAWLTRGRPVDGVLRCLTLVTTILAIHLIGLNELHVQARRPVGRLADRLNLNYRRLRANAPWGLILASQLFVCLFASLLLDGGDVFQVTLAAAVVFWSVIGCGLIWRTSPLSGVDLALLRYGYFALIPLIAISWTIVLRLKTGR